MIIMLLLGAIHVPGVGDGITDDTNAVQWAINEGRETGEPVYFPTGQYKITRTIHAYTGDTPINHLPRTVQWYGDGSETSVFLDYVEDGPMVSLRDGDTGTVQYQMVLRDMGFRGTRHRNGEVMFDYRNRFTNALFENVHWYGGNYVYTSLTKWSDTFQMVFDNTRVTNVTGIGMWFVSNVKNSGNATFVGSYFSYFQTAVFIEGGKTNNNFNFNGCKWFTPGDDRYAVRTDFRVTNMGFDTCHFEGCSLYLQHALVTVFTACSFSLETRPPVEQDKSWGTVFIAPFYRHDFLVRRYSGGYVTVQNAIKNNGGGSFTEERDCVLNQKVSVTVIDGLIKVTRPYYRVIGDEIHTITGAAEGDTVTLRGNFKLVKGGNVPKKRVRGLIHLIFDGAMWRKL